MTDVIVRTEVIYLCTASGEKVLDWTSGQMSSLIGHGHPDVEPTIADSAANLDHLYSGMLSPPVIRLAETLTNISPTGLDKAMFLSTGGESNECAIKLAKMYTGKYEIVGRVPAGMARRVVRGGHSIMPGGRDAGNAHAAIARLLPLHIPHLRRDLRELTYGWTLIDKASAPILSSGGMIHILAGYMSAMKASCHARNMLLIVDEAQTALGRAGDLFAVQYEDVVPDVLTLSKTLGNGLPLSAVITSREIADVVGERGFMFYTTHASSDSRCRLSLTNCSQEHLAERSRAAGAKLRAGLQQLMERYGCIGAIRERALMAGIEIVKDWETKELAFEFEKNLSARMMELGLSATISTRTSLVISG
ncbi:2,2-dialkylglycine decarboxylase [Lachnellula hyalina]|uniref:2,2-dialkylglycine decarboxylase n=1 Tax=Lachnellula hyalina TaxID=1316788 RepID=A0A8H8U539_9HELO|nr:2,2-dialkylglycine decarboxylase [Lachnellula hyalina]TVY30839.1 2,2-dialkylglycine decarboxylase [Lachnellula hyalina]